MNNIKTRVDHGTHIILKDFWGDVAEAMNSLEDNDSIAFGIIISPEENKFEEINQLQLWDFDIMTPNVIKKR